MQSTRKDRNPIVASVYNIPEKQKLPQQTEPPLKPNILENFLAWISFSMGALVLVSLVFGLVLLLFDCHYRAGVIITNIIAAALFLISYAVFERRGPIERGIETHNGQTVLIKEKTAADDSYRECYEYRNGLWHGPLIQDFDPYGG